MFNRVVWYSEWEWSLEGLNVMTFLNVITFGPLTFGFSALLRTSTSSRSIKTQQKNSCPHAWSVTHMNIFHADLCKSGKGRQHKNALASPEFFFFLLVGGLPFPCNLVHKVFSTNHTSMSSKSIALKSLSHWYQERYWSAFSLFWRLLIWCQKHISKGL